MHCKHCGFVNGEEDHRCLRCGRRLSGVVIAAPPGYSGANALPPAIVMSDDTQEVPPVSLVASKAASKDTPAQPTLFASGQVTSPGPQRSSVRTSASGARPLLRHRHKRYRLSLGSPRARHTRPRHPMFKALWISSLRRSKGAASSRRMSMRRCSAISPWRRRRIVWWPRQSMAPSYCLDSGLLVALFSSFWV